MKRRIALSVLLWSMTALAVAAGPQAVRKQAESSLLVTGKVLIDTKGNVEKVEIDQPDKLGTGIVDMVQQRSKDWRFEPIVIDGHAVRARAPMTLRLVAKQVVDDKDSYAVEIRSANFGSDETATNTAVTVVNQPAPRYPRDAVLSGVGATVFLVLRIGADGAVEDAIAEQTNLNAVGSERDMDRFRNLFERSSLAAAKTWTYRILDQQTDASHADEHRIRVPVGYAVSDNARDAKRSQAYGQWKTYIPGPRRPIPWMNRDELMAGGADAVADGNVQLIGSGLRLLTPLDPG